MRLHGEDAGTASDAFKNRCRGTPVRDGGTGSEFKKMGDVRRLRHQDQLKLRVWYVGGGRGRRMDTSERPAWATQGALGRSELSSETLSQNK